MRIPRVDPKDATGLIDKMVGLGKEITGEIFDQQRLIEAGEAQAQQAKGTEKLKAIREQAKADAHKAKARTLDAKERTAQAAKS